MVITDCDSKSIVSVVSKISAGDIKISCNPNGETFQRGDDETGVWTEQHRSNYIDALYKGFPAGIITFIKHRDDVSFMILDGANRIRAVRDYINNGLYCYNTLFSDMCPDYKAVFKQLHLPCQWVEIDNNDSENIVSEMFINLNTTSKSLSQGELIKAYGWRNNIACIEIAKHITKQNIIDITNPPNNYCVNCYSLSIMAVRDRWMCIIGELTETQRWDTCALLCGLIVSANNRDISLLDKRYLKLRDRLNHPINPFVFTAFHEFLSVLERISISSNLKLLFRINKYNSFHIRWIAPLWYLVINNFILCSEDKVVLFYNRMFVDGDIKREYDNILNKGGDNGVTLKKLHNIVAFINGICL
jgi:hypothetical protein